MFQTEIHHFLQTFDSFFITNLMRGISLLGYKTFYIIVLFTVVFGINYKKGFIALHVIIWVNVLTNLGKNLFCLPRPLDVDNSLKILETNYNAANTQFCHQGAKSFFGQIPEHVLNFYRTAKLSSYGFPSGHVSSTTALFATISYLFQKKWVLYISICLIVFMPVSRLFLGQHFLADVTGGLVIGFFVFYLTYVFVLKKNSIFVNNIQISKRFVKTNYIEIVYFFILPASLSFVSLIDNNLCATILGINLAHYISCFRIKIIDESKLSYRLLRILLVFSLFIMVSAALSFIISVFQLQNIALIMYFKNFLNVFITWYCGVKLNILFGFYKTEKL